MSALHPSPSRRLELLTLGLGSAAVAGASLPEKAEAGAVMLPTGIIVNTDVVSDQNTRLRINLDLTNYSAPIVVAPGYPSRGGWQFEASARSTIPGFAVFLNGSNGTQSYSYLFHTGGFYSATQSFDLSTLADGSFAISGSLNVNTSGTDTWYIGLRRTGSGGLIDQVNGWAQLQFGSATHLQSAFNFDTPSSIAIGQVPEPSSALLLAAGSAGLLTARRRRNAAA